MLIIKYLQVNNPMIGVDARHFSRRKGMIIKMKEALFPYGKEKISYCFKDEEYAGLLELSINSYSIE